MKKLMFIIFMIIMYTNIVFAQEKLINISVLGAEAKDVFVLLTKQSGMNIISSPEIHGKISLNLENVTLKNTLSILEKVYNYEIIKITDNTFYVKRKVIPKNMAEISINGNKLSYSIYDVDIREVAKELTEKAGLNIVVDNNVKGNISGRVRDVDIDSGLVVLFETNGYSIMKDRGIYKITSGISRARIPSKLKISYNKGKVSIDAENENVIKILKKISTIAGLNMMILTSGVESISLKLENANLNEVINILLEGANYTYKIENKIYIITRKNSMGVGNDIFNSTELIKLKFIQAEKVPSLLPNDFSVANIKVISNQNALLFSGTDKDMSKLKSYIKKLDEKVPQIKIEALIVEISKNKNNTQKLGLQLEGVTTRGKKLNVFDTNSGEFTYENATKLNDVFYTKLQLLIQQGLAKIKAKPSITTINGEKAVINVGTVQYYKVVTLDNEGKEKIDYKSVNAGVTLDVTPWINSTGDISLKLNPTISNIGGAAPAEGPPTVSKREAKTTVRVKDGETIVIGGLEQNVITEKESGIPILKDIPLLGELFKTKSRDSNQTELLIYITPRIVEDGETIKMARDMSELIKKAQ
ncbi:secretin and TonB N-terminal domain-containing protein [Haliovirga abyssi]|uniref:Secretin/TonB short N-terminal domain-containing protein n=1 Tax=Haliovirga abyssi TaxID=2996794 RepID=A0AAU9D6U5_9FUSO|nr:secretin and TonB N-terminal domain-containing protein [Haliovirga abyssi]BDU51694.1 hypothetical protein HLVA_22630 [Haliovirga abyssi]